MPGYIPKADPRKKPQNQLEEALSGQGEEYFWPDNLVTTDHYISFDVYEHIFRQGTAPKKRDKLIKIKLPMTDNLQLQQSQNYSTSEIGIIGKVAAETSAAIASSDGVGSFMDKVSNVSSQDIRNAIEALGLQVATSELAPLLGGFVTGGAGGAVAASGGVQAFNAVLAQQGIARNPFLSTFYNTPGIRNFTLSWKLIPKTELEQGQIHAIVSAFRYYSSPDFSRGQIAFEYPDMFDITFNHGDFLYKPKMCVCNNIDINYHSDGKLYHKLSNDLKAPVAMTMTVGFQETMVVTKGDIKKGH